MWYSNVEDQLCNRFINAFWSFHSQKDAFLFSSKNKKKSNDKEKKYDKAGLISSIEIVSQSSMILIIL